MAGYTRQSLAQILNGEIVSAPPLNAEFNQILSAFNNSTGHKHDGTTAEGPPIDRIADLDQNNLIFVDTSANQINFYVESSAASVGQISIQDGAIVPFTDNDIDLGSSSFEFKDLYIDGTANIDSLVADTADINAGTIDNTIIGATTPAAATFTNLTVSTGSTINFSGATVSNGGTFTTVTISGGSITGITDLAIADGGTGASTASAARTNLGVAIGTNVQAYDAGLQSISGLTTTADQMIYTTSSDTYATTSLTSAGRALLDDAVLLLSGLLLVWVLLPHKMQIAWQSQAALSQVSVILVTQELLSLIHSVQPQPTLTLVPVLLDSIMLHKMLLQKFISMMKITTVQM
jgi:hypothetical protein